ncbi:MAG: two-component response regulator, partial [Flaviaesturariibacter sp.]|nr:two-component response regulator [Flaviaesturariibacter sp.]
MSAAKKILLADDDKEDRAIFEEMLEDLGSAGLTHYAIDGEDALAFLRTCATFPSLIILDLNMPRLNGKETLHAIRKDARFASIPVYIYSTSLNPIERDE